MQVSTQILLEGFGRASKSRKGRSARGAHCNRKLHREIAIVRHNNISAAKGVNKVYPRGHFSSIIGYGMSRTSDE